MLTLLAAAPAVARAPSVDHRWTTPHTAPDTDTFTVAAGPAGGGDYFYGWGDEARVETISERGLVGSPHTITGVAPGIGYPTAVTDAQGRLALAWEEDDQTEDDVHGVGLDIGTVAEPVSGPANVSLSRGSDGASDIAIALAPDGSELAAWDEGVGPGEALHFTRLPPQGPPQDEIIGRIDTGLFRDVAVGVDAQGRATVTWTQPTSDDGPNTLFGRTQTTPNGEFGPPQPLGLPSPVQVLTDAAGRQIAVWALGGEQPRTFVATRQANGAFGTPHTLVHHRFFPLVALARDGHAVIVWSVSYPHGRQDVRAAFGNSAGAWRPSERVGIVDGAPNELGIDATGHAELAIYDRRYGALAARSSTTRFAPLRRVPTPRGVKRCGVAELAVATSGTAAAVLDCDGHNRTAVFKP